MFLANFDHISPPHDIHGWKGMDLSFDLAPSDQNLKHPTSRQNFGDGPGQTPKLIQTLCLIIYYQRGVDHKVFKPYSYPSLYLMLINPI